MNKRFGFLIVLCFAAASLNANRLDALSSLPEVTFHTTNESGTINHLEGRLTLPIAKGNEISETYYFLNTHKEMFDLTTAENDLKVKTVNKDQYGYTHVRLNQQHQGVRVLSGELISHFSQDNILKTINGKLVENIDIDVLPTYTSSEAVESAQAELLDLFKTGGNPTSPELVIFPWENEIYLCWRFFLTSDYPMGRWEYLVDAKTNSIVFKANRIMNSEAIGTGLGVMGNSYDHIDTDFNGSTYSLIDYTRRSNNNVHNHNGLMGSGSSITTSVASSSLPGIVATDSDNFWTSSSQASAVDGHMYTLLFYDWLLANLGRNGFTDNGTTMSVTVDYTAEGTNNAYWNGSRIVVWGWSAGWRSLAGCPDVIAHEWGHAVTQYTSDLAYQRESGALNESFSDMIGAAFEFAHAQYDSPDWYMGENGIISGNGFRSMSNPNLYGDPATYGTDPFWNDVTNCTPTNQNDWCYVHTNSGVGNKWFYLLSDGGTHNGIVVDGIGVENAIKVAYRANAEYWTSNSTYQEAALGTISAANDLDSTYAWTVQVSKAWAAVNIDAPNPEIGFTADTTWGWVPLDVNFEGSSILNVQTWDWNLGDGTLGNTQNVSHQYTNSGMFNVTLEIDADGDIKSFTQPNFIIALADTVIGDSVEVQAGESVEVIFNLRNTIPLSSVRLPVEIIGNLSVSVDSFSTVGCRTDYLDYKEYVHYDIFNKRFTCRFAVNPANGTPLLPPGYGQIMKLYITVNGSAQSGEAISLVTDGYESYLPLLEGTQLSYNAATVFGTVALPDCLMRGDINSDNTIDIADLVAFVDFSFNSGNPPSPIDLADVNCNSSIDIEDIVYFVAYMFNSGPPPCGC